MIIGPGIKIGGGITISPNITQNIYTSGLIMNLDAATLSINPTTWTDSVNNLVFTLFGSPVYNSGNGGYLLFDGSSQYAYTSTSFASLNTWTLDSWYYYNNTSSGQNGQIITEALGSNVAINYKLGYKASGAFVSGGYHTPSTWYETTPYTLTNNTWNNIICTYDGINIKIYVNGTLVQTNAGGGTLVSGSAGILLMSEWSYGNLQGILGGRLGIVRMYNKDIGSTGVTQNFNFNKSRFGL